MGNKLARTAQLQPNEFYLSDLPSTYNLVLKEVLGGERLFKSVLCVHDEGLLVVKIYFKRGEVGGEFKEHAARLEYIKTRLKGVEHSHLWPFQSWLETDKAAYLLRQYFFSNLHDRISTRPFLSLMEKKWIAFQLLVAVRQCHERGICHGDLKCENVLVTSWNWVYLADFASFKPTYLPYDNPIDFSFFFDTGGWRRCYLAPERFYDPKGPPVNRDSPLKPAMDIFSLGCVIAELFLEGQTLFDLSQLLAYRKGQYDPKPSLEKIPDEKIRAMVEHMLQLSPDARATSAEYLKTWAPEVFPSYFFPNLHQFFAVLINMDPDTRVVVTERFFPQFRIYMIAEEMSKYRNDAKFTVQDQDVLQDVESVVADEVQATLDEESVVGHGRKVKRISSTKYIADGVLHRVKAAAIAMSQKENPMMELDEETLNSKWESDEVFSGVFLSEETVEAESPSTPSRQKRALTSLKGTTKGEVPVLQEVKCEGMVLIASLLCACVRNVKRPQSRRRCIQMLHDASRFCDDDARLQHILPYVVSLLSDSTALVRCAALQTLCHVLSMIKNFPPSDAKIFPEYILPLLSMLPDDLEESVRIAYANNIYKVAKASYRFLVKSHHMAEAGEVLDSPGRPQRGAGLSVQRHDSELSHLRETVARIIQELVMGQKQTPTIRRALLKHVGSLCHFFGPKQSNDFLLPVLPAFLNDRDEQLRAVFFEYIVHVCLFVGQASVENYLLPYIEQALNDVEETVIVNALECLAALCKHKLLRKRILLVAVERACPLLCHPSQWVRRAAVTFVAASSASLEVVDSHAFLTPILFPLLRREPASLRSESSILVCLKPPVSREVLQRAVSNALQATPVAEPGKTKTKGRQRLATIQPPPDLQASQPRNSFTERRKVERDSSNAGETAEGRPKSSSGRKVAATPASPRASDVDNEDGEKMKAMEGYLRNLSSTMQSRMHMEAESTEKLENSAVGLPPGVGAGYYSHYDGSLEGIPLYSLPVVDKKAEETVSNQANVASSYNEDWSRVGGRQSGAPFLMAPVGSSIGPASSQWATIGAHSSMPPGEPMQRSMAAVPVAPRFMAGSFYHGGSSTGPRRAHEVFKDGKFTDPAFSNQGAANSRSSMASSAQVGMEASPGLEPVIEIYPSVDSVTAMLGSIHLGESAMEGNWRPKGVLIANLQEHQRAVNQIAVAHDSTFVVSGSDDGTVKVWDCRRLERDISFRSRLTYSFGSKVSVLCVTMLTSRHELVAASSTGKIHSLNVDYVAKLSGSNERYTGFTEICKLESDEGAVLSLHPFKAKGPWHLLYSTQRNGMHLCDLRAQTEAWVLKGKPAEGYITSTALDPNGNWIVSGTSRGILTLWDLRFQIPVNTWQHPLSCPIESMCPLLPTANPDKQPSLARPFIYVAAGQDEIALWNAEDGSCHQVMRLGQDPDIEPPPPAIPAALSPRLSNSRPGSSTSGTVSQMHSLKLDNYRMDELNDPPHRLRGVRALFPLAGGTGLLSAGSDCRIRMWDRLRPERSYTVCGPTTKAYGPEHVVYETSSVSNVRIIQESIVPRVDNSKSQNQGNKSPPRTGLAAAALDCVGCHRDCISSLAFAQANQRFLISSSRDGSIKVWK
ncbi:hypothetical protein Mapa_004913 [Marchantia paleacea]|nr:hypothetical protein Mapa_004913 [Marchantia paleacea]